jgi:hypothetical protein
MNARTQSTRDESSQPMRWRDWLSIEGWFFTTAAAQGLRDARRDYPREDTYVEVSALVQPLANSTRLVPDLPDAKQDRPAVLRLAPYEFEELKIAEERIDRICEVTERARQRYESTLDRVQHRIQRLLREAQRNRAAHAEMRFARPHALMPMWLYVAVVLATGGAALLLNASAFRLMEPGPDSWSYALAAAPALALLVMAHFLGIGWRRPPGRAWIPAALAGAIPVTITLASYAIGIMRAEVLEVMDVEAKAHAAAQARLDAAAERAALERQIGQLRAAQPNPQSATAAEELARAEQALAGKIAEEQARTESAAQAVQALADARRDPIALDLRHVLLLFAVNALVFMTAACASYYTHDGDRELERIVRHKARLRRAQRRWWRRWSSAAARYDRIVKTARQRINRIVHEYEAMVGEYRYYNTRKRAAYPTFFRENLAGRAFLVRSFGPESEPALQDLRRAFEQIELELSADAAPLAAAVRADARGSRRDRTE